MASSLTSFLTGAAGGGAIPRTTSPATAVSPSPFTATASARMVDLGGGGVFTGGGGGIFTGGGGIFNPPPTIPPFQIPPIFIPPTPLPPVPVPPAPVSPTATASDLQIMISAIPIAQDGHVITADFHNALRLALVAIANRLGIGPVSEEITITNAPRLSPVAGAAAWDHDAGLVRKASGVGVVAGNVRGWMEMELPDAARIKKMMVFGTTTGAGTLKIKLKRQKITDPTVVTDLIVIEIPHGSDTTKGIEGDVTVPGTGAGSVAIEEFRIVNNREQKYLLTAELDAIDQLTSAQFHSVQIVCGR